MFDEPLVVLNVSGWSGRFTGIHPVSPRKSSNSRPPGFEWRACHRGEVALKSPPMISGAEPTGCNCSVMVEMVAKRVIRWAVHRNGVERAGLGRDLCTHAEPVAQGLDEKIVNGRVKL